MIYLDDNYILDDNVIVMGDVNIFYIDLDIGIGEDNCKCWLKIGKCSFLLEECEWLNIVIDWGFEDSFWIFNLEINDRFLWFDYCLKGFNDNCGFCIDLILVIKLFYVKLYDVGIDYELRGIEKLFDYVFIWVEYKG